MPTPPRKGETEKQFMSRCISHIISKEGKSKSQAAAICGNLWRKKGKSELLSLDPTMAKLMELLLADPTDGV